MKLRMRVATAALLAMALLASALHALAAGTEVPSRLVLGMVPSREAEKMVRNLEPLSTMLEERLGIPVYPYVATSFTGLIEAMKTGKVDIGIFGPFGMVLAEERAGAIIILNSVRRGADHYRAQFNVRADSNIRTLQDLKGKVWGYVDEASTSGFLYPYVMLKEHGIDPEKDLTMIKVGAHDAAVLAVYNGDVDFSTTFEDARVDIQKEKPDVMQKVRVLAYTDPIPNDGVVVRKELHPDLIRRIQQALIDIGKSDKGRQMLNELYNVTGFVEATSERYDIVRRTYQVMRRYLER